MLLACFNCSVRSLMHLLLTYISTEASHLWCFITTAVDLTLLLYCSWSNIVTTAVGVTFLHSTQCYALSSSMIVCREWNKSMQVEVVRSLCRQCGLPDKRSKVECVLRLQKQYIT